LEDGFWLTVGCFLLSVVCCRGLGGAGEDFVLSIKNNYSYRIMPIFATLNLKSHEVFFFS